MLSLLELVLDELIVKLKFERSVLWLSWIAIESVSPKKRELSLSNEEIWKFVTDFYFVVSLSNNLKINFGVSSIESRQISSGSHAINSNSKTRIKLLSLFT